MRDRENKYTRESDSPVIYVNEDRHQITMYGTEVKICNCDESHQYCS